MSKPVYFLADLHLPAGDSPLRATFLDFIRGEARAAAAVYLLGDLFEYWAGDDIGLEAYGPEACALRDLVHHGVPVYFQHGNRDFLVGQEFVQFSDVVLLPETQPLDLHGERLLLTHGDQYCTDDLEYQRWRRFSRRRDAQFVFRCLPRGVRERIAGGVRRRSASGKPYKAAAIMDVNDGAVQASFAATGVDRIIHGHTHRPADHPCTVDGKPRIRTVLADWRPDYCEVLRRDPDGFRRIALKPSSSR